jgi:hypothetical protein
MNRFGKTWVGPDSAMTTDVGYQAFHLLPQALLINSVQTTT